MACCCGVHKTCRVGRYPGPPASSAVFAGVVVPVSYSGDVRATVSAGALPNTVGLRTAAVAANRKRLARYGAVDATVAADAIPGPASVPAWRRGALSAEEESYVYWRAGGSCVACGTPMRFTWNSGRTCFTVDHIQPKSRASAMGHVEAARCVWGLDNMQAMCSACNSSKGSSTVDMAPRHASIARDLGYLPNE